VRIRSITAFMNVPYPGPEEAVGQAGDFLKAAREAFEGAGCTVQTTRLAMQPFPVALVEAGPGATLDLAKDLEALCFVHEIDYVAIGPARLDDPPAFGEGLPDALAGTESVFASLEIASTSGQISLPALRRAAGVIQRTSTLGQDGFLNLRLAAIANCPPGSPFFPVAYHAGGEPAFALATEAADLAVVAAGGAATLDEARRTLTASVEAEATRMSKVAARLAGDARFEFGGIDFSLAPYPEKGRSIGEALEQIGVPVAGLCGSLAATALLADAIERADFRRVGFSGPMFPVLEDSTLAERASGGYLRLVDLLAMAAVCGAGLDTIPLPGDITERQLAALLLDVAALAVRLDKPLTARLMPLPGKQAGDPVEFDFPYFAESRVMSIRAQGLGGLLAGDEIFKITPRRGAHHRDTG
jgi:uncharacterized protein (UPF0210 family)